MIKTIPDKIERKLENLNQEFGPIRNWILDQSSRLPLSNFSNTVKSLGLVTLLQQSHDGTHLSRT